jgi:alanyl-tRNA synthetase
VERTVEILGHAYPELVEQKAFILQVAAAEEEHFGTTLRQGMVRFEEEVRRATERSDRRFPGQAAFLAHDTYGFPIELTVELAEEEGLEVDTAEFERLMDEQRRRARERGRPAGDQQTLVEIGKEAGPTEFVGYRDTRSESRLAGLTANGRRLQGAAEDDRVEIVLDRTPFYAEGGGQVGDAGEIRTPTGTVTIEETVPGPGGIIVHRGTVSSGEVKVGQEGSAEVDEARRAATARSHTGTHVLHWTLRSMLGEHARQAGSLVAPGRLRFDFNHFEALSPDRLEEIEGTVNWRLGEDAPVRAYETTFEFARSQGAIALFEETYGDMVRVVEIGDYSTELCGGTHVARTGQVSLGLLLSEGSIGSGLRRIEALVGEDALEHVRLERRLLEEVTGALGAGDPAQAPERARRAVARIKELEAELSAFRGQQRGKRIDELAAAALDVSGVSLVVSEVPGEDAGGLRELALQLRGRLEGRGHGAAVLGAADGGKATLVAACTKPLVERGITAPIILADAARIVGGGAGGKDHLAFAGGGRGAALGEALATIPDRLASLLDGG